MGAFVWVAGSDGLVIALGVIWMEYVQCRRLWEVVYRDVHVVEESYRYCNSKHLLVNS